MIKVALASGVQKAALSIVYALVIGPLKTEVWGDSQAGIQAEMAMATAIFSAVSSYYFGVLSDKVDRRLAVSIFGLVQFLPGWSLLALGFNSMGLWVFMSLQILAGLGVASHIMLVMANDMTQPEDREFAFGLFYALQSFVSLLGSISTLLVATLDLIPNSPRIACWTCAGLSVIFFAFVASMPQTFKQEDEGELPAREIGRQIEAESNLWGSARVPGETAEEPNHDIESNSVAPDAVAKEQQTQQPRCKKCNIWGLVMPFKLFFEIRTLGLLCITIVLFEFTQDLTFDIGGQFFMQSLDLVEHGTLQKQQLVSILSLLPAELTGVPAMAFVGWLAKLYKPMRVLWVMFPVGAVLIASGCLMSLFPYMWFVPIVSVTENFASLARIPLALVVTELAPEGRLGETMGALGMVKQIVGFLGNAVVALVTPALQSSGLHNPLLVFYPTAGMLRVLALLALPLVARQQKNESNVDTLQKGISPGFSGSNR